MESSIKQFEHLKIQIEAIRLATNNFSDENCIGKGGFGKVYKGELVHYKGQTMVALKRLNRAFGQGDPEFWKEIMTLSFYKHENIISLLGYCDDCGEKILVYEYAQNGSLDLYLDSDELTWIRRLKICIGVARGLAYLHSPMENQRVLHRDIKSSNILLDENWDAKISDFGLSKFGPANKQFTFLVSNAVGTIGYCDPLYVETGLLTKESDVYSFGVVLFEVLCGRLCIGNNNNKHRPLTGLARQYYEENKLQEIIHGNIKKEIDPNSLHVFTKIAYQCLKRERKERPLMTKIIDSLESALDYQVPSRVICGISEQEGASSTPPRPLSPLKEACSRMDLMAIHRILVMTHYRDDEEIELSFQEWTQHMRVTLEIKKRGDQAFRDKDFKSAIDFYSQFVNAGAMISLTVYARRCLCFLMCDQPDEALRDAMQAQIVNADWPTAFYLQFVALTKLDMHRDALDMLNEATQLEEKRQKDKF